MKKSLFIFFALFTFLSFDALGQSKMTEPVVKRMLCHKWKVISMDIQGEKMPADEDIYITFLTNGTFIDSQEGNQPSKDKWVYDHKLMTVTTSGVRKKIIKIDDIKLIFKSKMEGQNVIVTLTRVN